MTGLTLVALLATVAIGFDDFRGSDFSLVEPLFRKYGAAGVRTLVTEGPVTNIVYGVPTGELAYSAHASGTGRIRILAHRNRSALTLEGLESLAEIDVAATEPTPMSVRFIVPDAPETAYEPRWEGLGDKVMGLVIVYSPGLALCDVCLCLKEQTK